MWHGVAPALAERCTVVAADLPGYGDSFRPVPAPDHRPHGKRALAAGPRAGDARARAREVRRRRARPGRPHRLPDGAGPPGRGARRGGLRRRADRRGVGTGRRRDGPGVLALGLPGPARPAARVHDQRRPGRVLRPPRPPPRPRSRARALPGRPDDRVPAHPRRPERGRGDLRGLPRGRGRRPCGRRRGLRPRPPHHLPAARPVERHRGAAPLLRRRPRRLAALGRRPAAARASTRATSSWRTSPSRSSPR